MIDYLLTEYDPKVREAATLARDYEPDNDRRMVESGIKRERTGEHSSEWEAIQLAYGFGERS